MNLVNLNLLKEASVVGAIVVIVGTVVGFIVSMFMQNDMPMECKDWNKNFVMEICLFFTGFLAHVIFELIGANKWYCKNGNACKK